MKVWGIGANFGDGRDDMSGDFLKTGRAYIGWSPADKPELYKLLCGVQQGDIVYIKVKTHDSRLKVKAVGVVKGIQTGEVVIENYVPLTERSYLIVDWFMTHKDKELSCELDKEDWEGVNRLNTFYRETHEKVVKMIFKNVDAFNLNI